MTPDPLAPPRPARAGLVPLACVALFAAVVPTFGPQLARAFAPTGGYSDFVQEWLSARNFWAGDPVYLPQREALRRRAGLDLPDFDTVMPWNAHPPVAVLLALPFGLTSDYRAAHLAWNLLTFPLLPLALALVARELNLRVPWWGALAGAALVIGWNAVYSQVHQGQLNCVLVWLLALAWVADRRGAGALAGALAGAAAATKLFPGLLLVYFVAGRKWRAAGALVLTAGALHLVALAAFGASAFETYVRDVVPSLDVFRYSWLNVSLTGYLTRLSGALGAPRVGPWAALGAQLLVAAAVWRAARRAHRSGAAGARDRAFALAVVGMVLASPVAWTHYFVFVSFPLLVAWAHPPRRFALAVASTVLWLPERVVPNLLLPPGAEVPPGGPHALPDPFMAALGLAPFTCALVALFAVLLAPPPPADPT